MKNNFLPAIKITFLFAVLFLGIYTAAIYGIAQMAPNKGNGAIVTSNGKTYYANIAQKFTDDKYFSSRPSAVAYNAAGSGGSNKGPSNPDYLKDVQTRIDTFLSKNPAVRKENIPADLVTASGSGLDPDISPEAAYVQVARIAKVRNINEDQLKNLVRESINHPLWGFMGPAKVNVLKLNISLDNLKH